MKPLKNTPLGELKYEAMEHLVQDVCEMFNWHPEDYQEYSFFELLGLVVRQDAKRFSMGHVAVPRVLHRKLDQLRDTPVHQLCRELKDNNTSLLRGELTLFSFLKKHLATLRAPAKQAPPMSDQDFAAEIIRKRRENGSL